MEILMDVIVFFAFIACVLFVGFFKSRRTKAAEANAEDYFLAGRGLKWWLIGFSLIAANISAEQFVGMSGQGAGLEGISCASWEWTAAITLVVVAFCFLPYFLKTGITTMPEFIEMRFNHVARTLMTLSMIGILVVASLIGVTYAGSLVMWQLFNEFGVAIGFSTCCVIMSCIAGAYVLFGGLKACAWADLIQGAALIVGGALIAWIACRALGEASVATSFAEQGKQIALDPDMGFLERFNLLNEPKMHMGPANTTAMTWTVLIMGIWIPHFYYWGLNQYITQRLLGSGSLAEGQKGIVLAAALKLLIPFIIVIPGVIAFNLFAPDMAGLQAQKVQQSIQVSADATVKIRGVQPYRASDLILFESGVDKGTWTEWAVKADGSKERVTKRLTPADFAWIAKHNAPILARLKAAYPDARLMDGAAIDAATIDALAKASGKPGEIAMADGNITVVKNTYKYDGALGLLMKTVRDWCPPGVLGFILAALLGAIVSSLAAVLNATSTLFTMDIYQRYLAPRATQGNLVFVGRVVTVLLVIVGCVAAAALNSDSIFAYIQSVQCYVSPGVFAVFAFGMLNRSAGRWAGTFGLIAAPILYYCFSTFGWHCFPDFVVTWFQSFGCAKGEMHYLIAASYTLCVTLALMCVYGLLFKMPVKVTFEQKTTLDMTMSKPALVFGLVVCVATVALYVIFW